MIFNAVANTVNRAFPTIARYGYDNASASTPVTPIVGVFMGCEYYEPNGDLQRITSSWIGGTPVKAGTLIKAQICDDYNALFKIQASTSTNVLNNARFGSANNGPAVNSYFGQNYGIGLGGGGGNLVPNNPAIGNTSSGLSAAYLNIVDTNGATNRVLATLPLKALAFLQTGNSIFDPAFPVGTPTTKPFLDIVVTINNHALRSGTAGITPA